MGPELRSLEAIFDEHAEVAQAVRAQLLPDVLALASQLIGALGRGGKLLTFGNGGSAADAQHFAAELLGHFRRDRRSLAAIALSTDTSTITAIANDYGFDHVFERQVDALAAPGDIVVGISTSGDAQNVVRGIRAARRLGARTWAMSGASGGTLADAAEYRLLVPADATARIQEMHITIIHAVSELIDARVADERAWDERPRSDQPSG
jgi:D-sedoheptulose 7-phosphate isomerase